MQKSAQVVVAQLGARDHYAYARAFEREGQLLALLTDLWWTPGFVLPGEAGQRLAGRWHADLAEATVRSHNVRAAAFECVSRIQARGHWESIMTRNAFFQKLVIPQLEKIHAAVIEEEAAMPVLFSYSYAAGELFKWAKAHGWKTILGQIDPGPGEDKLLRGLRERHREFGDKRESAPEAYYASWREEIALADAVMVNSEWSRELLAAEEISPEKLHVLPIPFEAERTKVMRDYPQAFTKARPLKLLFLGQVNLRKGLAELLEAMSLLTEAPVVLDIVGRCDLTIPARFQALLNIRWHGGVPRQGARHFFAEADLFVLPTHSDGFGLTQLEALAVGLPVIATKFCAQLVEDGRTGRILEEVSGESLANVLRDVLESPGDLEKWSGACEISVSCRMESVSKKLSKLAAGVTSLGILDFE